MKKLSLNVSNSKRDKIWVKRSLNGFKSAADLFMRIYYFLKADICKGVEV